MIHELRIYTYRQGTVPDVLKNSATVSRAIRGDDYGKLEGYWFTDIGPLNRVVHLWAYTDLNERARLRAALAKNERWIKEYQPLNKDVMVRQDIRLMDPVIGPVAPAETPNVYEMRTYRIKPGAVRQWVGLMTKILPVRERYSKPVGLWITDAGQPNEVVHIWPYKDLNHRAQVRAAAVADPEWQVFLAESAPLLDEMHSTILLPAPHSPLK
jgi:hypothetical protein